MNNWAAIFDWDGVIIDSSRQHERGWELLAAEEHRVLPKGFFKRSFGMKNERVIAELLGWSTDVAVMRRLCLRKEELYRQELRQNGFELLPGVKEWLSVLSAARIPCAIGSSTPRLNIEFVIGPLGIGNFFQAIVTAEDVTRGKPDPEVFLLAAARLGFEAKKCVVFEDAHVGIEAARAAGMKVVALTTTHPRASLQDANLIVAHCGELAINQVMEVVGGKTA